MKRTDKTPQMRRLILGYTVRMSPKTVSLRHTVELTKRGYHQAFLNKTSDDFTCVVINAITIAYL